MIGTNKIIAMATVVCLGWIGCKSSTGEQFSSLDKSTHIGNWTYRLRVENQTQELVLKGVPSAYYYLKATLSMANSKTKNSLLYSASRDQKEYESHYRILAFDSKQDLYLKHNKEVIYPIGYVFEPSNGLVPEERLIYKFAIPQEKYEAMEKSNEQIAYWYTDHLIGLGKICFNAQN